MSDAVQIPLRARDGSVRAFVLVDEADAAWLNQWRWSLLSSGYAHRGTSTGGRKRIVLMHRAILGLESGDPREGDHINLDRLDNRRENLRAISRAHNRQNVTSRRGATSRHRGVCWDSTRGVWLATAAVDGKLRYVGQFSNEDDAAAAAAAFRAEHMPYSQEALA